jgi:alkaline phosphatase D
MRTINRRDFVAALLAASAASPALAAGVTGRPAGREPAFLHGVASGDPLHDRVILWTRVTPARLQGSVAVQWRIAKDRNLRRPVAAGAAVTDPRRDYTVKVDVGGLDPGHTYYYGFRCEGVDSPVGRTRTLPQGAAAALRFAFVSCSNYPYGYFNAYRRIAERADLDFVLHLGDYLYEYALGEYADPLLAGRRDVQPTTELLALADYRLRHALYKTDADLQELHRQHPMICVWDDHESANDAWRDGAENHNPEQGEGEWSVRRAVATRAYDEYMPIRTSPAGPQRIYRSFAVGSLADLIMLDTRLVGRDQQAAFKGGVPSLPMNDPTIQDPGRTLLGFEQEAWLNAELSRSKARGATWRFLGQQVMMAQLSEPGQFGANTLNPDQWDGYDPARRRLFAHLAGNGIDNNVVLTGDIHSSWCNDLTTNPWDPAYFAGRQGILGVEFVAPAITSPGPPVPPGLPPEVLAGLLVQASPHMKYVDLRRRGYGLIDADHERVQGEIWHVDRVDLPSAVESFAKGFVNPAGANGLQPATGPTRARAAPDPA